MKALLATFMLAVVLVPFASAAQKPAARKEMKAAGTVVSATDTSLVVSSSKTKKETTYVLNADTKKQGSIAAGAKVRVEYTMNGKERIATMVEASGGTATVAASTPSGAKAGKKATN